MKEIELRYTEPQLEIFFSDDKARHVLVQKGRRFGATKGAANACIEWLLEGHHILWGDTIHSNINKYFDRYFLPELKANKIDYHWAKQERSLTVGKGYLDFRSADNPENWEGFGYSRIILNEAGIILQNPYLYTNAVRPMMLDHPDAVLYALGVPKGKMLKDGTEHPFYTMCKRKGDEGYRVLQYSSYDNPLLKIEDIEQLETDMSMMDDRQVRQEIYGDFIDKVSGLPFAPAFDQERHVKPCAFIPDRPVFISFDFNIDPFAAIYYHLWRDGEGWHMHIFDEETIKGGTVDEMCDRIRYKYGVKMATVTITGDYNGNNSNMVTPDKASAYLQIKRKLKLTDNNFDLRPNPRHTNSREHCNYVLHHFPDFRIDPKCLNLTRDLRTVEVDENQSIKKRDRSKSEQRADHLDAWRYAINGKEMQRWITDNQRRK